MKCSPTELLRMQMTGAKLSFTQEFRFHPTRRWRADFALPKEEPIVLVEVEGGSWVSGRHTRGVGFEADCMKYNAAVLLGYAVLRFTTNLINTGYALATIEALAKKRKECR